MESGPWNLQGCTRGLLPFRSLYGRAPKSAHWSFILGYGVLSADWSSDLCQTLSQSLWRFLFSGEMQNAPCRSILRCTSRGEVSGMNRVFVLIEIVEASERGEKLHDGRDKMKNNNSRMCASPRVSFGVYDDFLTWASCCNR